MKGLDLLSEGQKQCLRLIERGYEPKEIGRELNLSVNTVNKRLAAARASLGVNRSKQAARILAKAEGDPLYQSVGYQKIAIDQHPSLPSKPLLSDLPWPVPTKWRQKNDLSVVQRLAAVWGIAALFMSVVGFYLVALKLFNESF